MRPYHAPIAAVLLALSLFAAGPSPVHAEVRPVQLAIWPPLQVFPPEDTIHGVRLSLYGLNQEVQGLDVGIFNRTLGKVVGLQYGIIGYAEGDFTGWQDNMINVSEGKFTGLAWGLGNSCNDAEGFLLGFVNMTTAMNGFQLGFINYTRRLHGLQVGLLNIVKDKEQLPVLPIVNWSF